MVLDKEELRLAISVVTSTFEVRRPLDKKEVKQLANELNKFYDKYRRLVKWYGKKEDKNYWRVFIYI